MYYVIIGLSSNTLDDLLAPIVLSVCKYPFRSNNANECNFHSIGIKPHHQWHHFCFIITSKETNKGKIESTMILIYDGIIVKEGKYLPSTYILHIDILDCWVMFKTFLNSCR